MAGRHCAQMISFDPRLLNPHLTDVEIETVKFM